MSLLFLVACSKTQVHGVVVDGLTGEPLPGVDVGVAGATLTATTDASGIYAISDPAAGPQKLTFHKDGYVVPAPLELTLEARRSTEAAKVGLFPALKPPLALVVQEGTRVPLLVLDEYAWKTWSLDLFTNYSGFPVRAVAKAPHLRPGMVVYAYLGSDVPADLHWLVDPLLHEPAGRLTNPGLGMGVGAHSYRTEERYTINPKLADALTADAVAPGWWAIPIPADLAVGLHMLSPITTALEQQPGGIEATLRTGFVFQVDAPPAEVVEANGTKLLKVIPGDYSQHDQQWQAAQEVVLAWCSANASACERVNVDLRKSMEGMPDVCNGRLTAAPQAATFWNGTCGGSSTRVHLNYNEGEHAYEVKSATLLQGPDLESEGPYAGTGRPD